jgi:lipopolysaccharide transport system permease protein
MKSLFNQHHLITQFVRREIEEKYRGSFLGLGLSLAKPLAMLAVYTVVFGFIFEGKMTGHPNETRLDFVLSLFCGLIVFEFFSEIFSSSPGLITSRPNLVTKVVFPLEILPLVRVISSLVQMAIASVPLILFVGIVHQEIPWGALFFPLILLPLILLVFGLASFLSALGVFLRDLGQIIPSLSLALMFASAIFYPLSKVPENIAWLIKLNPLALVIEEARRAVVWNEIPDFGTLALVTIVAVLIAWAGHLFFLKTKPMFADVI